MIKHCADLDKPQEVFDTIKRFHALRHLTLSFDLGLRDHYDHPIKPYLTVSVAEQIYAYLLEGMQSTHKIRNLTLESGAPAPMGFGMPSSAAFWPANNSVVFYLSLSEDVDRAANNEFTMSYATDGRGPYRLRPDSDVIQTVDDGKRGLQETHRRLIYDGPVPPSQWQRTSRR